MSFNGQCTESFRKNSEQPQIHGANCSCMCSVLRPRFPRQAGIRIDFPSVGQSLFSCQFVSCFYECASRRGCPSKMPEHTDLGGLKRCAVLDRWAVSVDEKKQ